MNLFYKLLSEAQKNKKTFLCVGLDPRLEFLPKPFRERLPGEILASMEEGGWQPSTTIRGHRPASVGEDGKLSTTTLSSASAGEPMPKGSGSHGSAKSFWAFGRSKGGQPGSLVGTLVFDFLKTIVDVTEEFVCCFKPQMACFSAYAMEWVLLELIDYIHKTYPQTPVILDAKRGDIGSSSEMYSMEVFDRYRADAVTVNPYMGGDCLEAFTRHRDKGVFILCRTSNPGAGDFQELKVNGTPLYVCVAQKAFGNWNQHNNIGLVVGATAPMELKNLRTQFPQAWFLVPGVGAQGASLAPVIKYANSSGSGGLIINSSRAILYAGKKEDYAKESRQVALAMQKEMAEAFL